jgi:hypothetical protein
MPNIDTNIGHEYGLLHNTVELINPGEKDKKLYCLDIFCIQQFHTRNLKIPEQIVQGLNPQYSLEHADD